ncbi:MAG: type IV secretion system protein [Candidatus Adiutrix sp.]|jgi:type IV secretion system protein VirB5|nr:type IV secretion system protein [Candidatus Adiutrix sp.]
MSQKTESQNPYLDARDEFYDSVGYPVKAAAQWRLAAFISFFLLALSLAGNVIQATQAKVVPYVVAVDKIGAALAVKRADIASPTPVTVVQAELANIITNWRTVTADLDLQARMIDRLSGFTRGAAKGVLTEWFEKNNPVARARSGRLVSVNIKSVPLPVSQNSWRIEWLETTRNHVGVVVEATEYEATMNVVIQPPRTDAEILKNPGGVYITELSFGTVLAKSSEAARASHDQQEVTK